VWSAASAGGVTESVVRCVGGIDVVVVGIDAAENEGRRVVMWVALLRWSS
jgi:hypothetical protein